MRRGASPGGLAAAALAAALLLSLGGACSSTAETGVLLLVEASDALRPDVASVRVRVRGGPPDGGWDGERSRRLVAGRWPLKVAVRPEGGEAARRFEVTVEAFATADGSGEPLVRQRVESGFVAGEWRQLTVWLREACRGVLCGEGESCGLAGRCAPTPRREPRSLPPLGEPQVVDGGGDDGGPPDGGDGGRPDAGDGAVPDGGDGGAGGRCPPPPPEPRPAADGCTLQWLRSWPVGRDATGGGPAGRPLALEADDRGVYVAGRFHGTTDLGGGPRDGTPAAPAGFVAAFDGSGCHRWDRILVPERAVGRPWAEARGLARTASGLLLAGTMAGCQNLNGPCCGDSDGEASGADVEGFVLLLDPGDGELRSARRLPGDSSDTDEVLLGGLRTVAGEPIAWGTFSGRVDLGERGLRADAAPDAFALRLDARGDRVGLATVTLAATGGAAGAVPLPGAGGGPRLAIWSRFEGMESIGGAPITSGGVDALLYAPDGGAWAFVRGTGHQNPPTDTSGLADRWGDLVLLALEARGATRIDAQGAAMSVAGVRSDDADVLVVGLEAASLAPRWQRLLGSTDEDKARVLRASPLGVLVGGRFGGRDLVPGARAPMDGGADPFLVVLDPADGTVGRALLFGAHDRGRVTAAAAVGQALYVAGTFDGAWIELEGARFASGEGSPVAFLARFDCAAGTDG